MPAHPRRTALLDLCRLLAPGAKRAVARTALAFDEPRTYAKQLARRLDDWGVEGPTRDLPWLALVFALIDERRVASIDWKASFAELRGVLDRLKSLPKNRTRWAWAKTRDDLESRSTAERLEIIGRQLRDAEGFALGHLVLGADNYQLIVVPRRDEVKALTLGKRARYGGINLFTGSDLRRFEREREAEEAKARRARAREEAKQSGDPDRQRQFIHPDGRVWVTWASQHRTLTGWSHTVNLLNQRLGVDLPWDRPGVRTQRTFPQRNGGAKLRKEHIAARLREGFVEVTRTEWVDRNAAAKRKRR